jgi:hypothetical protein
MKQMISLPRLAACANCSGRTVLEYDRIDVGAPGQVPAHLSAVPYFQCQECDHRQMDPVCQERLGEGLERYLAERGNPQGELWVMLHWREVLSLNFDLDGDSHTRLYEVEWSEV